MTSQDKAREFRALHEGEAFVIPNPWDAGSARVLQVLGFRALATTSSGLAFTLGREDGNVTLSEVTAHIELLDQATELPVSADLEDGYGSSPQDCAHTIERAAEAGAVGGSIEDYSPESGIYERAAAAERVAAAVESARKLDPPFMLTARAENHIRGNPDLEDTIERLLAYEKAGADVLYAPGLANADEVELVCREVSKPVNVLAHGGLSVAEVIAAGAQRISVGGALAWVAVAAMAQAAKEILDAGDLSVLNARSPFTEWLGSG